MNRRLVLPLVAAICGTIGAQGKQQPKPQPQADTCAVPAGAPPTLPAVLMEGVGKTSFPITTSSAEAQAFFNQGVAQMHSFWFRESERSFLQAAALDPDAAMAYWGIAMSAAGDYRPAFQLRRNRSRQAQPDAAPASGDGRAREAIAKATALVGKMTERERLYIAAAAARRNRDSKDRDGDYVRALRRLVAAYPDDLEAKSILALAIQNGYEPVTLEPREGTMESLALLREILARDPQHFGAHHYVIHGSEGGRNARDAWESCRRYPELVPNIPHALHMPGHIYAATGRLEDAVHAFASAGLNELGYMRADTLYGSGHFAHNQHFLIHALGIEGRYREAMTRARELLRFQENPRERDSVDGSSAWRQGWFCVVKTLVRFERWGEILDGQTLPRYDKPREAAWRAWAVGLAHAARGDAASAAASLGDMRRRLDELEQKTKSVPAQLEAARAELEGCVAAAEGKGTKGLELLRKAARLEDELLYTEPPAYPRPVVERLGKVALEMRAFREAESAYRRALEREPASGRALWGLAQSLEGSGNRAEREKVVSEFTRAWSGADSDLPELGGAGRARVSQ